MQRRLSLGAEVRACLSLSNFMCLHRYQSHWRPRVILTGADKPFNLYAANLREQLWKM